MNSALQSAKAHHGGAQRASEEREASLPGWTPLFLPDRGQALLRAGLCERRRSECLCFYEYAATHLSESSGSKERERKQEVLRQTWRNV